MSKRKKFLKQEQKMKVFAFFRHNENYKGNKKNAFVALPHTLINHPNFLKLKPNSQKLYLYMTDYANGLEYFTFPKKIYERLMTKQTFQNCKNELIQYGFIEEVTNGKNTRKANQYKFSDKWKTITIKEKKKRTTKLTTKSN